MGIPLPTNSAGFSDAIVILGAAGIVIPAFARFRINPVIGFILVGLLVGPSGLGALVGQYPWLYHFTITDPHAIEPFAEFGIILLLFSIGLELSFRRLWSLRRLVFGLGASELLICGAVTALALQLFGYSWQASVGLGFALALSSTALVLPITGTGGPVGSRAFSMLLFEDLALVPIIFALGALAPYAQSDGLDGLVRTLWSGALVVVVMLGLGKFALPHLFTQAARTKSPELFLAASLLVVILASVATSAVGLSPIVGALLAGLLIAETDYHGEVEVITAPFKGLALGVFLISVGMGLDVGVIAANWMALGGAVVGVVLIKTLVTGTLTTTAVALLVAIPIGTIAAIWLSEFAPFRVREVLKPTLELLSAVPTVVYGYFALQMVTPFLQRFIPGLPGFNMLSPGLVIGIMIVPYVASVSEDAMRAVPNTMREGSYAMGATRFQTAVRVVMPGALSGIAAAYVLGISRAVGETMVVAVAAGLQPNLTWNPLESAATITSFIVQVSLGDLPHGSVGYQSIFAAGLVLMLTTLAFNVVGVLLTRRFREVY